MERKICYKCGKSYDGLMKNCPNCIILPNKINLLSSIMGSSHFVTTLILLMVFAIFLGLIDGCTKHITKGSTSTKQQNITFEKQPTALLKPGIAEFFSVHPELGTIKEAEYVSDWASGARQRIITTDNKSYLIYLLGNEVVTVKQYNLKGFPEFTLYKKELHWENGAIIN